MKDAFLSELIQNGGSRKEAKCQQKEISYVLEKPGRLEEGKIDGRSAKMSRRVCVTGGAGYIGSWLVKKLLDRGCTVHATLRNLGDEKKTELLKGLPGAAERLTLFQADIYDAATFEPAIQGCEFVFLVATPMMHDPSNTKYKDSTEAMVDATRAILQQCERSKTVRRVIHTGSVTAASPFREDGHGYKEFINESCWTPLDLTHGRSNPGLDAYVSNKTLSAKELLKYNDMEYSSEAREFDVVVLLCGLVGGDTILPYTPSSIHIILSPLTGVELFHTALKWMQDLHGSVPLIHVDDVCEAHIFCMEQSSSHLTGGRYLCATAYPNMNDFVEHYTRKHPAVKLVKNEVVGEGVRVQANTNKLVNLGFQYKYGPEEVLDGSVQCGKKLGLF